MSSGSGSMRTCGLIRRKLREAERVLGRLTSRSVCRSWRFRLDSSTLPESQMRRVPTPAAARYMATGLPSPPAPAMNTVARLSAPWPVSPQAGNITWRW